MSKSTRGAINEHKATVWLLDQGYYVLRNVSPVGPVDLVAMNDEETIFIDVKQAYPGKRVKWRHVKLTPKQERMGVRLILVHNDYVGWKE